MNENIPANVPAAYVQCLLQLLYDKYNIILSNEELNTVMRMAVKELIKREVPQ